MVTRKALADFPEGALGIILTWPNIIEEGASIEVILPDQEGKMSGHPVIPEDELAIMLTVTGTAVDSQIRFPIMHLIKSRTSFITLHTKDSRVRAMLWTFSTWTPLPAA